MTIRNTVVSWLAQRMAAECRLHPVANYQWMAGESSSAFRRRLRRRFLQHVNERFRLRWVEGLRLWLYPDDDMTELLFRTGMFEPNEMSWFSRAVQPGMTVIDAGANAGLYTLLASKRVGAGGRVLAIEPSVREGARLREHLAMNHIRNVTVILQALSDRPGRAELRIAQWPHAGQNTLGDFIYPGVEAATVNAVEMTTIDQVVATGSLERVDLIKIDTEGADARVLRGAQDTLRRFKPTILIEVNDPTLIHQGSRSSDIWDLLHEFNYHVYGFAPESGVPVPATQQPYYADTVNLLALREPVSQQAAA